jgi:hypothetical protein
MATLANFRTRISAKLGLDNTASSSEQSLIDSWVNEGVNDVLMETQVYVTESTSALTNGQGDYTLDPNILAIKDIFVTSGSVQYILSHVSPDEIIQRRSATSTTSGPARLYAINGANNIMLYPAPSTGDTLTFWYVPRPTALSTGTDDPSDSAHGGIPTEWHKAIELYALWQGGDYADDDSSQQGERYHQAYEMWLKRVKKERSYKGGRLLGSITPGRRKRPFAPHDPSTDTGYFYS